VLVPLFDDYLSAIIVLASTEMLRHCQNTFGPAMMASPYPVAGEVLLPLYDADGDAELRCTCAIDFEAEALIVLDGFDDFLCGCDAHVRVSLFDEYTLGTNGNGVNRPKRIDANYFGFILGLFDRVDRDRLTCEVWTWVGERHRLNHVRIEHFLHGALVCQHRDAPALRVLVEVAVLDRVFDCDGGH